MSGSFLSACKCRERSLAESAMFIHTNCRGFTDTAETSEREREREADDDDDDESVTVITAGN